MISYNHSTKPLIIWLSKNHKSYSKHSPAKSSKTLFLRIWCKHIKRLNCFFSHINISSWPFFLVDSLLSPWSRDTPQLPAAANSTHEQSHVWPAPHLVHNGWALLSINVLRSQKNYFPSRIDWCLELLVFLGAQNYTVLFLFVRSSVHFILADAGSFCPKVHSLNSPDE